MGKAKRKLEASSTAAWVGWIPRALEFLERHRRLVAIALVVFASLRIVSTYTVFNHTFDEPAHIACGMEWLDHGVYQLEAQHPPLARVAAALGPYLLGIRFQGAHAKVAGAMWYEGVAILERGNYDVTLAAARLGILPFFWIACWVVYAWGKRWAGTRVALAALFLFSFLPVVLAHAGLATTDMALTAFLGAAFFTGLVWLEQPTLRNALIFGAATGLMTLSKFSGLVYFPAAAILALAWYFASERPAFRSVLGAIRRRAPSFGIAVLVGALLIWAGYRFSLGHVSFTSIRLPAPELYKGIQEVRVHNAEGHNSYLLGTVSQTGSWAFFPVAFVVKTPVAFLLLLFAAIWMIFDSPGPLRRAWLPLAFSLGIFLVAQFSRINIGLRHILPIYLGFSLLAAAALVRGIEKHAQSLWVTASLAAILLWFAGTSVLAHPDYLPYFNFLAGSHPENILIDSDLDWGQDVKRLGKRLRELGATQVAFDKYIMGNPEREFGFPRFYRINPESPLVGWNAVGVTVWKLTHMEKWPDRYLPTERVGKSMLLWYFPPPASSQ